MRKEALTWNDIEGLLDHLMPQLEGDFDSMLMITRGGIIPGGLIAEAMNITSILNCCCEFSIGDEYAILQTALLAAIFAIS